ncbi:MAG: filamentous hemagglutinin N-terminal domain-containing protein, partial [Pseudomonadota bacterium]|nr:filamentous hemagglutinin N-terminal domain-containing protein [Pseudomonadota bacterium]
MKRANNRDRGFGQSRRVRPTIGSDDRATAPRAPTRPPIACRLGDILGSAWAILPTSIALLGFHGAVMASVRSDVATTNFVVVAPPPTFVLPTGGQVSAGTASIAITPVGDRMNIVQSSNLAVIDWSTFSIGAGATVNFQQPSAASATLNRVIGTDPSSLLGNLSANGKVWLINQAGIMVGPTGRVDVAEFVATTLQ